jgi:hypothetical protein
LSASRHGPMPKRTRMSGSKNLVFTTPLPAGHIVPLHESEPVTYLRPP